MSELCQVDSRGVFFFFFKLSLQSNDSLQDGDESSIWIIETPLKLFFISSSFFWQLLC